MTILIEPNVQLAPRAWWCRMVSLSALFLAAACGRSSSFPTDAGSQHTLSVSAGIYNVNVFASSGVMLEVQLLVDGVSVADQQYPNGSDVADFEFTKTYSGGGTHQVSIRVVKQRNATNVYSISGAAIGIFGSTEIATDFPSTNQTLSAGGQISVSVAVP